MYEYSGSGVGVVLESYNSHKHYARPYTLWKVTFVKRQALLLSCATVAGPTLPQCVHTHYKKRYVY